MSPVRVAPTRGDGIRALVALSKWASRHAERNMLNSKKAISPDALIERTHTRQLAAREKVFERDLPFSWIRFFIGTVSLALVFSDVLRSGVGVSNLQEVYPSLQPDEVCFHQPKMKLPAVSLLHVYGATNMIQLLSHGVHLQVIWHHQTSLNVFSIQTIAPTTLSAVI
ncbi:hypothetical protein PHPALM_9588 [Phytophthora palmivora]|uniref:Uncharacterized protein n=1 Tax=Phytophthora palmivora TaxID=4796 RepID=A0A2P4Y6W8_9STRA|nr:hypothetical protein PHPALM_9588 [Phytophthora palmivora]